MQTDLLMVSHYAPTGVKIQKKYITQRPENHEEKSQCGFLWKIKSLFATFFTIAKAYN
jgi:hypothetical protein